MKIKEIISSYGLNAFKKYGQHFLTDPNILNRIARITDIDAHTPVIEIGPGPGGLTRSLIETDAPMVFAVELDIRCIKILKETIKNPKLSLINKNALLVDTDEITDSKYKIVGNLPYNIATPLIIKWLTTAINVSSITAMVQKEVALRMVAKPSTKDYGRLSVIVQLLGNPSIKMALAPGAFYPPPKVESCVVHIDVFKNRDFSMIKKLESITHSIFSSRRKMMRSVFKEDIKGFDMTARGETLSPQQIYDLCKII